MLQEPKSMDECVYFTNRILDKGKIKAWVFKEQCPKCAYKLEKGEYEDSLTVNIKYTCPFCSYSGETQESFKRKKVQKINEETGKKTAVDAVGFQCEKCKKNIDITRKMK